MVLSYTQLEGLQDLSKDDGVLVSFSAGPDSMALLDLLCEAQKVIGFRLCALHFDHDLRPSSGKEAQHAQALCRTRGIPCSVESLDVRGYAAEHGSGLEGAGHALRRDRLLAHAAEQHCEHIALGHHADDQAETFLLHAVRGSALDGLTAMPVRHGLFWRPLLTLRKKELLDHCQAKALDVVFDASNEDTSFARNLVRHEVIPLLEQLNPKAVKHILQATLFLQDERRLLDEEAQDVFKRLAHVELRAVRFNRLELQTLAPARRRRILQEAAVRLQASRPLSAAHLSQSEALIQGLARGQIELADDLILWQHQEIISLEQHPPSSNLPDSRLWKMQESFDQAPYYRLALNQAEYFLDPSKYSLWLEKPRPFLIRRREPGDRIALAGLGHKELKDLFRAAGFSPAQRDWWPIVCEPESRAPLWVPGLAVSEELLASSQLKQGFMIEYQRI